ncbi:hypothetical protein [Bradyrhizobium sp. 199]|uniref:hypothetical protein n=1 Tax=Bradyrhizobium sp. 199 TaxID=2782664 RepID=UPI001FF907D6|nr:hypothetical protein [Bradyrhizobium sp. 199]MCK1360696.1 hypothetical protein [Bradyrhizobium sp. 199]
MPNDEVARRLECQPNGKTEAWHILDAGNGATALLGTHRRPRRTWLWHRGSNFAHGQA